MATLGFRDKGHQELFEGDTVQIVNGSKAGTTLYNIKGAGKPYTIIGHLDPKDPARGTFEIVIKKVRKVTTP